MAHTIRRSSAPAGSPWVVLCKALLLALMAVLLTACAGSPRQPDDSSSVAPSASSVSGPENTQESADAKLTGQTAVEATATLVIGTDSVVQMPERRPPISLSGDAVMLNFEQAPINEVIHTILGDTLALDYVIENQVPGEITLRTRSPVPREQLLPILESLLRNNNVLMVRGPNDRFFISGSPNIRSTIPRFDSAPSQGFSNVIVPLQYIGAVEMTEILKPVAQEDAFVRVDEGRNLLILAGTQLQLEGWLDIVSTFDVDQLAGMSVGIFPLVNATVEELAIELELIIASELEEAGLAGLINILPVERLNSILVVSPRAHYVNTVGEWVKRLDSIDILATEPTLHVYSVRNGDASQLSSLLSTIFGGSSSGASGARSTAPGLTQTTSGGATGQSSSGGNRGGSGNASTLNLGDGVKVVSDDYNNSLLVYATTLEYQKIERVLTKLDVVATQVLIEASIVEVTLVDDLEYGLEWAFSNNLGGGDTGTGSLNLGRGAIGPNAPGFSYTITNSASQVKAVLNALAQESLVNVISTPSVMVLDNHTANIHVGQQQPIQSASTVTNGGNVQNSITYKDTGVKLQVTPSVNDGGLVTMEVDQSVTDVGVIDAATNQRSFLERNVTSKVAVRSGETVVLGGLIRDNESTGKNGIPLLMDIPVVGSLFSTTTNSSTRTELLVFITPRVLESEQDLRDLNREMRRRMKGLKNYDDLPQSFDLKESTSERDE